MQRKASLLPSGIPKYLRIYDNGGKTFDRFTIVFTGKYRKSHRDGYLYAGSGIDPTGFYQHGENATPIDKPGYAHLGKKIPFGELPKKVQSQVISDYKHIWQLR